MIILEIALEMVVRFVEIAFYMYLIYINPTHAIAAMMLRNILLSKFVCACEKCNDK